ncbi:PAS domain-containing sensor histidine kinase [Leucobacter viscericola]|uniref:histidine kinase n=2 Tax=Leucobacter viscericola TaxID=2714935 RepID=A0A6G7XK66_9MICO|nr:PAS domain-containing sensor histidine kinase [Leucobacter viscericola]
MAIALVLTFAVPDLPITSLATTLWAGAVIFAATAYAGILSWRHQLDGVLVFVIPILDIIGFGMLRAGTGAGLSIFGSLVLIPVVWLAMAPGIRYVFVILGMTSLIILMPYFFDPPSTHADWLRGVITPVVYAAAAAIVNVLSRQQRRRAEQAEKLVSERTKALAENFEMIAQLRTSEQQYRTLLDSFESLWSSITAQAVIATDCRGTIEAWNPGAERMLGLSSAEALDSVRIDRFFPSSVLTMLADQHPDIEHPFAPADMPAGIQALFARADTDTTVADDIEIATAGGSTVPARVTVTPRKTGTGEQRGYLLVVTDETRAVEVARMKDEFVGMISHELRTPLSAIIGFIDLLRNDPETPLTAEQNEFVSIIERNAQRLLALVGDLLFTAQVESGRFPLEPQSIDICDSVRSAVRSATPHAQREGIVLAAELPEEPVMMLVDPRRMGQALDNLLSNAIKFTPRDGQVTAGVDVRPGEVVLYVRDTGLGIPKDEQGMLYNRFFRASTATRNAVPGVGLGLTITKAIVIAHGGTMDFTSVVGEGTEFRMSLPLAPKPEAASTSATND